MKQIKIFALIALCLAALSSCISHDNEYAPEYEKEGMPVFGKITMTPSKVVTDKDAVSVEVDVVCPFGIKAIQLYYWLDGNFDKKVATKVAPFKGKSDVAVTYKGKNIIPKQRAGVKVSFQLVALSTYDMSNTTNVATYEVVESEATPEQ